MLPRDLKFMNTFVEGVGFAGECQKVTLPPLTKKTSPFRGGGMIGELKQTKGLEPIEVEHTYFGYNVELVKQSGVTAVDGLQIRWVGSYQRDDEASADQVEIVVRGFHEEIPRGDQQPGEENTMTAKTACSYYKESLNGQVLVEIDILNMVWTVNGVDILAQHRANIGL